MTCSTTCSCKGTHDQSSAVPIVTVNGTMLSPEDIAREMANHTATGPEEAWRAAARSLIVKTLLMERASDLGLTPMPMTDGSGRTETHEEALARATIEQDVSVPEASADECKRFYDCNLTKFTSPPLHEVSHILIARRGDAGEDRRRAALVLNEAIETAASFESLAALYSECPSRTVGGSLGQLSGGETVAEFDRILPLLQALVVHPELVETRYGYHIIRLDRRIPGRIMPFEHVASSIRTFLDERVRLVALRQYAEQLVANARIEGIDLAGKPGLLVQ